MLPRLLSCRLVTRKRTADQLEGGGSIEAVIAAEIGGQEPGHALGVPVFSRLLDVGDRSEIGSFGGPEQAAAPAMKKRARPVRTGEVECSLKLD